MRIHDIGPRTELDYAPAKGASSSKDGGTPGFVERDRPYIDDQPAHRHGWEARSRWGSQPVRPFDRDLERKGAAVKGLFHRAWTRVKHTATGTDPVG